MNSCRSRRRRQSRQGRKRFASSTRNGLRRKPPFVRLSLERDYRQSFTKNILPFMGDVELNGVTVDMLENFRIYLVTERGLALKTARNIIDGSLKAMILDAAGVSSETLSMICRLIGGLDCRKGSPTPTRRVNVTPYSPIPAAIARGGLMPSSFSGSTLGAAKRGGSAQVGKRRSVGRKSNDFTFQAFRRRERDQDTGESSDNNDAAERGRPS